MTFPTGPSRHLCVAVDAKGYGSLDDLQQHSIQRHLLQVLDTAADAADLRRLSWLKQPGGDAELAILPAEEPEARVVDRFVRELSAALRRHNSGRHSRAVLRVRAAVHFGRLVPAANGFAGPAPVAVTRLLNSEVLRRALTESPAADLAVLLSDQVYADTVAPLHTTWRPDEFRRVRVHEKEFDQDAWLWVADCQQQALDPAPAAERPAPETGGRPSTPHQQTVNNTIHSLTTTNAVFGFSNS